ncbi:MAG: DUF1993 domain-containing protein [Cyanobacteria bacterium J06632_22]
MKGQTIDSIKTIFESRLTTLTHLLNTAEAHFEDASFLERRIVADMLPLGTQVAFTCNQPRNFSLWCEGKPSDNLNPEVASLAQAREHITHTQQRLSQVSVEDGKLSEMTRIELGQGLSIDLLGMDYVHEFLLPNFYFHLVTAYDILRMAGVPIGKKDYMMHLVPLLKTA